jgi:hypothetical protein
LDKSLEIGLSGGGLLEELVDAAHVEDVKEKGVKVKCKVRG